LSLLQKSHDFSLASYGRISKFAMVSGATGRVWLFVEFVSRQRYAVACPVNAQEGIVMAASITVMFCVCMVVVMVVDPIGIPAWSNIVMLNCDHRCDKYALFIVSWIGRVSDRCMLAGIVTFSM